MYVCVCLYVKLSQRRREIECVHLFCIARCSRLFRLFTRYTNSHFELNRFAVCLQFFPLFSLQLFFVFCASVFTKYHGEMSIFDAAIAFAFALLCFLFVCVSFSFARLFHHHRFFSYSLFHHSLDICRTSFRKCLFLKNVLFIPPIRQI